MRFFECDVFFFGAARRNGPRSCASERGRRGNGLVRQGSGCVRELGRKGREATRADLVEEGEK